MSNEVYIIGRGAVSGIGLNKFENLDALKNSQTGIGKIRYLNTTHAERFLLLR